MHYYTCSFGPLPRADLSLTHAAAFESFTLNTPPSTFANVYEATGGIWRSRNLITSRFIYPNRTNPNLVKIHSPQSFSSEKSEKLVYKFKMIAASSRALVKTIKN